MDGNLFTSLTESELSEELGVAREDRREIRRRITDMKITLLQERKYFFMLKASVVGSELDVEDEKRMKRFRSPQSIEQSA